MDNKMFHADYIRHEYIYAANPTISGWNDRDTDGEILSYVHELLKQAKLNPPSSILEVGCGMGNLAIPLASAGFGVVGIDISTTAVEIAGQRAMRAEVQAHFRVGNVTISEAYQDLEPFDGILDGLCWHCIIGQDRQAFLGCVRQALKPQGCFLIMTMCGDPRSLRLQTRFDPISRYITSGLVAKRYLGKPQDLEDELNTAGFQVVYRRLATGNDGTGDQDMFLAVARPR